MGVCGRVCGGGCLLPVVLLGVGAAPLSSRRQNTHTLLLPHTHPNTPTHTNTQVVFNPKDTNTFASASLDRTVKVWSIGQPTPNFTLEGHEKGVNAVDYFQGASLSLLLRGRPRWLRCLLLCAACAARARSARRAVARLKLRRTRARLTPRDSRPLARKRHHPQ